MLKRKDECIIHKDRHMLTRTNNMHCSIYYSDKGNVFRFESGNR